ncbi:MAG: alpha/beta hydrolase, partial [Lysobacterales bacterium]
MSLKKGSAWCIFLLVLAASTTGCVGVVVDEETIVTDRPMRENTGEYVFPVGFEAFNDDVGINFLLNRTYSMGYARYEDMVAVGEKIESRDDLMTEMTRMADVAVEDGRLMNAAFYYRAAELYALWSDPVKASLYDRFIEYFYLAVEADDFELIDIPYGDTFLSVMHVAPDTADQRGTIIVHAGYDGFKEELYSTMRYLSANGYEVISFDVPWMGRARTPDTAGLDYEWEKPIGAILDHYEIDDASLFGISFGGWLALRAAAFEPRISRVIASSVSLDVNQYAGRSGQLIARFFMANLRKMTNNMLLKQMDKDPQQAWFFDHLMHVTNKTTPIEATDVLSEINEENIHSELVTQDVLILTGKDDHLVPFKMHNMQIKALVNAASVTPMVFTSDVHGQNHCQVGNLGLALDIVVDWLDQ